MLSANPAGNPDRSAPADFNTAMNSSLRVEVPITEPATGQATQRPRIPDEPSNCAKITYSHY